MARCENAPVTGAPGGLWPIRQLLLSNVRVGGDTPETAFLAAVLAVLRRLIDMPS